MKRTLTALLCGLAAYLALGGAVAAKDPKPLFSDNAIVTLKIVAPFSELIRNAPTSTKPYPATLTLSGEATPESHAIMLSARGKSRRDKKTCRFPPLRVEFKEKPGDDSLFDGQKRLKLVTHCRPSSRYQQYYVREYAAYRLLNAITPLSLKVRIANIEYVKADSGKTLDTQLAFFIEDVDDAAKRNGLKEIETGDIAVESLEPAAAATYAVFQYMIGNLDWSMRFAPENDDCCHNTKLMGERAESLSDVVPVPYDFDYSGLVNASYTVPPESINVRSVRTRRYRGFCRHNTEARIAAARIHADRSVFIELINSIEAFDSRSQRSTLSYLEAFFEDVSDEGTLEKKLLSRCRR